MQQATKSNACIDTNLVCPNPHFDEVGYQKKKRSSKEVDLDANSIPSSLN